MTTGDTGRKKRVLSGNTADKQCVIEIGTCMTWSLVLLEPQGARVRPFRKLPNHLLVVSR